MAIQRREDIKRHILGQGEITLKELIAMYPNVSAMTLRRDLIQLENEGYIRRTHGGAVSLNGYTLTREDYFSRRAKQQTECKQQIAHKAQPYAENLSAMYLDSGTTAMLFARLLPNRRMTIITSAPSIAVELTANNNIDIVLTGGHLASNTLSLSGEQTLQFLSRVNIDTAFMSASGYTPTAGFTSGNEDECRVKRAVIQKAGKVIMLMDATKVGRALPFTFAQLPDIDILISDDSLSQEMRLAADQAHVQVL